ncbi:Na+/H+ antiporter subunit E [Micromonospora halophytica]|uniref:Multicomponent Na+:H+ antiporter subunit E n=1 Tax=Micromonospora halophytica TaxID=47864 RepID=A0A1C5GVI8_9ACTN|nr:Na+/H+ antiporter subunit E [Micromonospora halophytica]SCG37812.1 multicomponent Na+:H+ antiporter subunit E [Micromonospora halophytica]
MSADVGRRAVVRTGRILRFLGWFAVRLVVANLVVAREILTPGWRLCPAIVRVPLPGTSSTELVLTALCVGLTPGTLTVGVRTTPPVLFVHGMYADDPHAFRHQIVELQRKLLPAVRPVGRQPAGPAPAADDPDEG